MFDTKSQIQPTFSRLHKWLGSMQLHRLQWVNRPCMEATLICLTIKHANKTASNYRQARALHRETKRPVMATVDWLITRKSLKYSYNTNYHK